MKLFLASTLKNKNTLKALKDFIPDISRKKVVYIPTASNSEEYFGSWKRPGETTYNIAKSIIPKMKVMELEFASDSRAMDAVQNSDILFVAGGFPGYLSYWLHRRKLTAAIKQRVQNNLIYIGISAGAMVCSKSLKVSTFFENDPFVETIPGMGIINYEIWPHYKESDETRLRQRFPNLDVKFLRDGDQILIDN